MKIKKEIKKYSGKLLDKTREFKRTIDLKRLENHANEIDMVLTPYNRKSYDESMMVKVFRKTSGETIVRKTHTEDVGKLTREMAEKLGMNGQIAEILIGKNIFDQKGIDEILRKMIAKEKGVGLATDVIFCISSAVVRTAAAAKKIPVYRYLGGIGNKKMPIPIMTLSGEKGEYKEHLNIQEFQIIPVQPKSFRESIRMCTKIRHIWEEQYTQKNFNVQEMIKLL